MRTTGSRFLLSRISPLATSSLISDDLVSISGIKYLALRAVISIGAENSTGGSIVIVSFSSNCGVDTSYLTLASALAGLLILELRHFLMMMMKRRKEASPTIKIKVFFLYLACPASEVNCLPLLIVKSYYEFC